MAAAERIPALPGRPSVAGVNNAWYDGLGARWYGDEGHAIALLRAEAAVKLEYVDRLLRAKGMGGGARILDIGCGAGFISLPLAGKGHSVRGVDLSESSLAEARRRMAPGMRAEFHVGDAYALEVDRESQDVVLMLDFLEHVERPGLALAEAARALKPGGILVFHTFNRTWAGYAVGVVGPGLLVRESPEHLHVYRLFLKPSELRALCEGAGLDVRECRGVRPRFLSWPFWSTVLTRRVHGEFGFAFTKSLAAGYLGHAEKVGHA